jgi:hypothetical protein
MVEGLPTSVGDYYDQSLVKKKLSMAQSVIKYDEQLDDCGNEANRDVEDLLTKYSATIRDGSALTGALFESAQNYAVYRTCYLFKVQQSATKEVIDSWKAIMKEKETRLIEKLATDPETNTQNEFVVVVSEYKSDVISD